MEENLQIQDSVSTEQGDLTFIVYPPYSLNNEDDSEFSSSDLANEYLSNGSSSLSVKGKLASPLITKSNPYKEPNGTAANSVHESSPRTSISTNTVLRLVSNPSTVKSLLESILLSNSLSLHDAVNVAHDISKSIPSLFGQILCTKITEIPPVATKQISICLFDRSLYERLPHLIALLPNQCIQNNAQPHSISHHLIRVFSPRRNAHQFLSRKNETSIIIVSVFLYRNLFFFYKNH